MKKLLLSLILICPAISGAACISESDARQLLAGQLNQTTNLEEFYSNNFDTTELISELKYTSDSYSSETPFYALRPGFANCGSFSTCAESYSVIGKLTANVSCDGLVKLTLSFNN